jgi:hypothetical protein
MPLNIQKTSINEILTLSIVLVGVVIVYFLAIFHKPPGDKDALSWLITSTIGALACLVIYGFLNIGFQRVLISYQ